MREDFDLSRMASVIIGFLCCVSFACASAPGTNPPSGPSASSNGNASGLSAPLVGTTWRLLSIDGRPVLAGVTITAEFTADGRVAGTAGCNRYFGTAAPKGEHLEVGAFGSTRMFCTQDGVMAEEQAFLAAFEKVESFSIAGGELRLAGSSGSVRLVFAAR
jgi:heat shock protein HslJ